MPLRSVRIYAGGAAELERAGRVESGVVTLPIPEPKLDEILKTLRIAGQGGESAYAATLSTLLNEQREGLETLGYHELLRNLEGEEVEVTLAKRKTTGRLANVSELDPEPTTDDDDKKKKPRRGFEIVLLTDRGGIERYRSEDFTRVALLEPGVLGRVRRALSARSRSLQQQPRELRVAARPGSELRMSYLMVMPLARISYRLRLEAHAPTAELHGLALVHNDSEEAWSSVDGQLVSGEPGKRAAFATPVYPNLPGTDEDPVTPPRVLPSKSALPARVGASYAYHFAAPLSVEPRSTALTTFLRTRVKSERGVWFIEGTTLRRNVLRLENATTQALPAGLISVFDGGRLAGEIEAPELLAGRVGYFDLPGDESLLLEPRDAVQEVRHREPTFQADGLNLKTSERRERQLELVNSGADGVAFLPVGPRKQLTVNGADSVEPVGDLTVATIRVPAQQHVSRHLVTEREYTERFDLDSIEPSLIVELLRAPELAPTSREALTRALPLLQQRSRLAADKSQLEELVSSIEESSTRLGVNDSSTPLPIAAHFVQLEQERNRQQRKLEALERELESNAERVRGALGALPAS